jgi:hypothetical protein
LDALGAVSDCGYYADSRLVVNYYDTVGNVIDVLNGVAVEDDVLNNRDCERASTALLSAGASLSAAAADISTAYDSRCLTMASTMDSAITASLSGNLHTSSSAASNPALPALYAGSAVLVMASGMFVLGRKFGQAKRSQQPQPVADLPRRIPAAAVPLYSTVF